MCIYMHASYVYPLHMKEYVNVYMFVSIHLCILQKTNYGGTKFLAAHVLDKIHFEHISLYYRFEYRQIYKANIDSFTKCVSFLAAHVFDEIHARLKSLCVCMYVFLWAHIYILAYVRT